jgi:hypothetical protein
MLTGTAALAQAPGAPAAGCALAPIVINEPAEGIVPDVTQFFFQGGCPVYSGAVVLVENQSDIKNPANWSDVAVFHNPNQAPQPGTAALEVSFVSDAQEKGITDADLSAAGVPMSAAQLAALPNTVFISELTTGVDNTYIAAGPFGSQTYDFRSDPASGDFSIFASPNNVTAVQGGSAASTISTLVSTGDAQPVALSASGLPAGASAILSPNVITAGASATLTLNAGTAAPGTYTITITGNGTSISHSTTVSFTITGATPTRPSSWGQLKNHYR